MLLGLSRTGGRSDWVLSGLGEDLWGRSESSVGFSRVELVKLWRTIELWSRTRASFEAWRSANSVDGGGGGGSLRMVVSLMQMLLLLAILRRGGIGGNCGGLRDAEDGG